MIRRGLVLGCLLMLGILPLRAAAEARLQDPRTGKAVTVEAGAKALHLVFFATWCPQCVEELSRLAELKESWGDRGYRLVVVAVKTRHTPSRLADFADRVKVPGELLFDAEGQAENVWNAGAVPTHVVLDAGGNEAARSGALDEEIETALRRLLSMRRETADRP